MATDDEKARKRAELEALQATAVGWGSLLEPGDNVEYHTHAGNQGRGEIEDTNAFAMTVRTEDGKLYFVPFSSVDVAEIFVQGDDDEDNDEPPAEPEHEETDPDAAAEPSPDA